MFKNKILFMVCTLALLGGCRKNQTIAGEAEAEIIEREAFGEETEEPYIRQVEVLEDRVKAYLDENDIDSDRVGLAYYNLEDAMAYELNGDQIFLAASTSKLPIVMYLFDLAHEGRLDLENKLIVGGNHLEEGTGTIYYSSGAGAAYSLYELADLMITVSDNTATNMIYGYLTSFNGEYILHTLARVYGLSTGYENYMTTNEAIDVLKRLYYDEDGNPFYEDIKVFMQNTIYNDYFTADMGEEKIGHKTGDFDGYYNDIGIVYNEDSHYAFAVYTDNIPNAIEVLNDLGKIMADWHRGDL